MPEISPFYKRIKRHIIGRLHRFFAATAPGFEKLCLQELLENLPNIGQAAAIAGGVEFEGRLEDCFKANLDLRMANRILMRIHTFKASNFRQLEKIAGEFAWELYLPPHSRLKIQVATRRCRLHHSDAIAERVTRAIGERLSVHNTEQKIPEPAEDHQTIYMRGVDDRFSASIDSSGDLLYRRGLKEHGGKAPLRETMAAGALSLAGYNGDEPLLDPLCGTGTFSLEAALITKRIPAGWFRNFAFTGWPSFIEKRWDYIRRQAESGMRQCRQPLIFSSDIDREACLKLERSIEKHHLSDAVRVRQVDFFDLEPHELTDRTGTVCINPPYGRRLGGRQESDTFFHAVGNQLKERYQGWKLALIAPRRNMAHILPFKTTAIPIRHGGLNLSLLTGKIR